MGSDPTTVASPADAEWDIVGENECFFSEEEDSSWEVIRAELAQASMVENPSLGFVDAYIVCSVCTLRNSALDAALCEACGLALTPNPCQRKDAELAQRLSRREEARVTARDYEVAASTPTKRQPLPPPQQKRVPTTSEHRANVLLQKVSQVPYFLDALESGDVGLVDHSDLAQQAARFIDCHTRFLTEGKRTTTVTIAYHYIKSNDVCFWHNNAKRQQAFGEGFFASNNPFAFHKDGLVCVMVAILSGKQRVVLPNEALWNDPAVDALVFGDSFHNEVVLRQSCQCLPLLCFPSERINLHDDHGEGNEIVWKCHSRLQIIMDVFFNKQKTKLHRVLPSNRPK